MVTFQLQLAVPRFEKTVTLLPHTEIERLNLPAQKMNTIVKKYPMLLQDSYILCAKSMAVSPSAITILWECVPRSNLSHSSTVISKVSIIRVCKCDWEPSPNLKDKKMYYAGIPNNNHLGNSSKEYAMFIRIGAAKKERAFPIVAIWDASLDWKIVYTLVCLNYVGAWGRGAYRKLKKAI